MLVAWVHQNPYTQKIHKDTLQMDCWRNYLKLNQDFKFSDQTKLKTNQTCQYYADDIKRPQRELNYN